ncbi:MAG: hypothetical protein ACLUHK_03240 [Eubacteriales bacterium]
MRKSSPSAKSVPLLIGLVFITLLSAGSTPSAIAGSESVARLMSRICTARMGSAQLKQTARKSVSISAIFPATRNWITF